MSVRLSPMYLDTNSTHFHGETHHYQGKIKPMPGETKKPRVTPIKSRSELVVRPGLPLGEGRWGVPNHDDNAVLFLRFDGLLGDSSGGASRWRRLSAERSDLPVAVCGVTGSVIRPVVLFPPLLLPAASSPPISMSSDTSGVFIVFAAPGCAKRRARSLNTLVAADQ